MKSIPNTTKRAYLKWLIETYGLIKNDVWVLRRIINSNVINRIHFLRTIAGKPNSIYLKIGDQKWSRYGNVDMHHYETTVAFFLHGRMASSRELLEYLRENPTTHLYIQVEYENSINCEKLQALIEPAIDVEDILSNIERKQRYNEIKLGQVNALIDEALDERNFEKLEKLRLYKATLINEMSGL